MSGAGVTARRRQVGDGRAAVLAIDGGNSKTDVALVGWDGTVLAALRGPGASQEAHGVDGAVRRLGELILAVADKAGIDGSGVIAQHMSPRAWPAPTCPRRRRR